MSKVLVINANVEGAVASVTRRLHQRMIETGDHRDADAFHQGRYLEELIRSAKEGKDTHGKV